MSVHSECKPRDSHCQRTPRQLQASPRTLLPVTTPDVGGRPAPHATTTPAGRPRRRRRGFTWAGRLALLTFALFVGAGAIGGGVAIATFLSLDDGSLPPVSDSRRLPFPEQSVVYARDTNGARAIRRLPPRSRRLEGHPARPGRRHHGGRGPRVLGEPGLRPDRDRGGRAGHVPRQRPRASTITQQLVRQRLLEPELVQDSGRTAERKLKEIIQSIKLTQAFPGTEGKQRVMTAYLNQNYYGNDSYGVAAAAQTYFGKSLKDLTLAQAAIIAAIPQAPSTYDLVRNAEDQCTEFEADGETCAENSRRARRASGLEDRPAPQPGARPDGAGTDAAHRRRVHGGRLRGGEGRSRSSSRSRRSPVAGAALRLAGPRRADAAAVR